MRMKSKAIDTQYLKACMPSMGTAATSAANVANAQYACNTYGATAGKLASMPNLSAYGDAQHWLTIHSLLQHADVFAVRQIMHASLRSANCNDSQTRSRYASWDATA